MSRWLILTLASGWLVNLAVLAGPGGSAGTALPGPLEVRGLTTMPGLRCAFFHVPAADSNLPPEFMVGEGESRFGIRVIAVDARQARVRIDYAGHLQDLVVLNATNLLPNASVNGPAGNQSAAPLDPATAGENSTAENLAEERQALALVRSQLCAGGRRSGANPNVPAYSNGVDPAQALQAEANTQWYQEALSMEKSRVADAQAVLAGEQTPWPRTPLTPAGTPAALVGSETLWANKIAGFYQH
jgi:hypothetical protein